MKLRRFNAAGVEKFLHRLDSLRQGEDVVFAMLLEDPSLTDPVGSVEVDVKPFATRRAVAEYFYAMLEPLQSSDDIEKDRGLWSWLACAWIDVLAPTVGGAPRAVGADARWVLVTGDYRKYYRHLLAGPYRIYRAHVNDPDSAMAVLAGRVSNPGEVVEQFASRQEMIANRSLLNAITQLYYDKTKGSLRRGAAVKGAGGARRLADVLMQLDMTWDIYGMGSEKILAKLPNEFDRFKVADHSESSAT